MAYFIVDAVNTGQQTGTIRKKTVYMIRLLRSDGTISREYSMTCTEREFQTTMEQLIADLEAQAQKTLLGS